MVATVMPQAAAEEAPTAPPTGGAGTTCRTCAILLPSADAQRAHMRTDWHRCVPFSLLLLLWLPRAWIVGRG
jgi:hypothetical protein